MCDYSLDHYNSRKAVEGEDLVLTRFPSNSVGFTSGGDTDCVVCCDEGMTITLHLEGRDVDATFAKQDESTEGYVRFAHHDGLTFDGGFVLLQEMQEGTRATVIKPLPDVIKSAANEFDADIKMEVVPDYTHVSAFVD